MPLPNDTRDESQRARVVAKRILFDANQTPIEVCVYEPVRDETDPNGDWRCEFSIKRGSVPEQLRHVWGVDSLQALVVAIKALRHALEPETADLSWLGQVGVTGIPLQIFDDSPQRTAMFRSLIDAEVHREALFWELMTRARRPPSE